MSERKKLAEFFRGLAILLDMPEGMLADAGMAIDVDAICNHIRNAMGRDAQPPGVNDE